MNETLQWERDWWGNCANTLREELLQFEYAKAMMLETAPDDRTPYRIDMKGKSVLDIGGGPCSLLLKCVNLGAAVVADPGEYPLWTAVRYQDAGIKLFRVGAESGAYMGVDGKTRFDEAWIYNVLQHVDDPRAVVRNAKSNSRLVRIFEWIDTPVSPGHPHTLTEAALNEWLEGQGVVEDFNACGAVGRCYHGVFLSRVG